MSLLSDGRSIRFARRESRPLEAALAGQPAPTATLTRPATIGIGHTAGRRTAPSASATRIRWSTARAHPRRRQRDRRQLHDTQGQASGGGTAFATETDAEVIAHLIASNYHDDLARAVIDTLEALEGYFAFVAMALDEPEVLVGARRECPLSLGEALASLIARRAGVLAHRTGSSTSENGES